MNLERQVGKRVRLRLVSCQDVEGGVGVGDRTAVLGPVTLDIRAFIREHDGELKAKEPR